MSNDAMDDRRRRALARDVWLAPDASLDAIERAVGSLSRPERRAHLQRELDHLRARTASRGKAAPEPPPPVAEIAEPAPPPRRRRARTTTQCCPRCGQPMPQAEIRHA